MHTYIHTYIHIHTYILIGATLLPNLRPVIHRCTLIRTKMTHVVNNLCGFLMFEVVETAWSMLQDKLSTAECLDDVIIAHDVYLEEIENKALLSPQHEELNLKIQLLIQAILRFCNLEETLLADAMASIARKRAMKDASDRRTAAGDWGIVDESELGNDSFNAPDSIDGVPGYVITRLDEAAADYEKQFEHLLGMLIEEGDKVGEIVRYLTFRLDFNRYYGVSDTYGYGAEGSFVGSQFQSQTSGSVPPALSRARSYDFA